MSISLPSFRKKQPEYLDHTYCVILAGGGGTRLWPKSRKQSPKQFLKLTGDKTMLQVTADRFANLVPWKKIVVVTTKDYVGEVIKELPQIPQENIIAEPEKKDTALAMLSAALYVKQKDPKAILINDAADHVVVNEKEFLRLMRVAAKVASDYTHLISVGITPTYPSSAFGYIKIGEEVKKVNGDTVFKVDSFTEKPNPATARAFISSGKYFWNANNYVWSAEAIQNAFALHMPQMHELTKSLTKMKPKQFHEALNRIYRKAESISIDYAISEKAKNLLLIAGDFGWDDIGEWKVVYDLGKKNAQGNVILSDTNQAQVLNVESKDCLIHGNGRLIAAVGLKDMIIVDTDEILMIAPMNKSQDIKKLVEKLKEKGEQKYL